MLGDGTEQSVGQVVTAVREHDDGFGVHFLGGLDDGLHGQTVTDDGLIGDAGIVQFGGERSQKGFGLDGDVLLVV